MNKIIKSIACSLILTGLFVLPALVLAETDPCATQPNQSKTLLQRLDCVAKEGGYQTTGVSSAGIIGLVLGAFLGFLGLTFIILIVIAGYSWMTAQGNEEKIKKSAATIKGALIGLVVCLSAWSLWNFVFKKLIEGG